MSPGGDGLLGPTSNSPVSPLKVLESSPQQAAAPHTDEQSNTVAPSANEVLQRSIQNAASAEAEQQSSDAHLSRNGNLPVVQAEATTPNSDLFFNVVELVERTILFLSLRDMIRVNRVSKQFNAVIIGSVKIQRALFLKPYSDLRVDTVACSLRDYEDERMRTPLNDNILHRWRSARRHQLYDRPMLNPFVNLFTISIDDASRESYKIAENHQELSINRLLFSHPPTRSLVVACATSDMGVVERSWNVLPADGRLIRIQDIQDSYADHVTGVRDLWCDCLETFGGQFWPYRGHRDLWQLGRLEDDDNDDIYKWENGQLYKYKDGEYSPYRQSCYRAIDVYTGWEVLAEMKARDRIYTDHRQIVEGGALDFGDEEEEEVDILKARVEELMPEMPERREQASASRNRE